MKLFGGIQQIGIGVEDAQAAWDWYRRFLGFDIPLVDDTGVAADMLPYTGGEPRKRRAILAVNLQGGGGLEIWQYKERKPLAPSFEPRLGDLGVFAAKFKTLDIAAAARALGEATNSKPRIHQDPRGVETFSIRDPGGNALQIVSNPTQFARTSSSVGGVLGALIGVSDLDASLAFYREFFGYDEIVYDVKGTFEDLEGMAGGNGRFRRALIKRSAAPAGAFSELLGYSEIELVQGLGDAPRKLYEGRLWGDLGFIQLCFDVQGMAEFKRDCAALGRAFTADSNPKAGTGAAESFDMGKASGHFAYVEDPDGTLIELVETHRVPILARMGLYLDLRKRDPAKPLPRWMLKLLRFAR